MPWWIWHWRTPIQSWRCLHLLFVSPMNCRIPLIPDACFDIRRSSGFGVLPWESPGAYCWYVLCAHSMYTRRQITPLWRSFTVITHTRAHTHTHIYIYNSFFFLRRSASGTPRRSAEPLADCWATVCGRFRCNSSALVLCYSWAE
jgi:hypothetical protein